MKYQHIVNYILLFETNEAHEFMLYVLTNDNCKVDKYKILHDLLEKSNGYVCKLYTTSDK